jgi:K+-transporting ATPase ATPase C chain
VTFTGLLRIACLMTIVMTLLLGIAYPLGITAVAQMAFPDRANGQLIERGGVIVGSRLIGQGFAAPGYFHPRPSATAVPYDAANSGGSQLGPTNRTLVETVQARVDAARRDRPTASVPIDLVTASASGLDPDVSPAAAAFQVPRVARARGVSEADIRRVVAAHTDGRQLGFFGEPRVNVLELNLALDRVHPMPK